MPHVYTAAELQTLLARATVGAPPADIPADATPVVREDPAAITAAFAEMRAAVGLTDARPTVATLRRLVDDVRSGVALDDTAATLAMARMDTLNLAAQLGIWLSHVHGGANVEIVTAASLKRQLPARARRNTVVVPLGYQRGAGHRREVSRAIAALVVFNPDDDELSRFITRQYKPYTVDLGFDVVSSVWYAATRGRLVGVGQVNPGSARFMRSLVAAYDLLSGAIARATDGVAVIMTSDLTDLDALADACTKCAWISEREMARVQELVSAAAQSPDTHRILERELTFLRAKIDHDPVAYVPQTIADLSKAHVRKIAMLGGVAINPPSGLKKAAVRTRLREMGFGSDVDMLIHRAAAADRIGAIDDFWAAMESRAAGELDWDVDLAERLGQVAPSDDATADDALPATAVRTTAARRVATHKSPA